MKFAAPFLSAAAMLMAGCSDDPAPAPAPQPNGPDDRTAAGDVQAGSISDAMLPLDQVQSQSPPSGRAADGADGGGENGGDNGSDSEDAPSEDDAEDAGA